MNLREEILREHSKSHALKVASYACSSKGNFKELIKCFLDDEYRLAQRAAWSVSWAASKRPEMMFPFLKDIISVLHKKNVHPAVIRNAVRVLQEMDIPQKYHGEVMYACFQFLEQPSTPVAIKVFSLSTLFNLSQQYPEIRSELKLIIEDRWEHKTAAFRARAKRILAKF